MIIIDQEKCIGCGLCVKDCFSYALAVEDGKAWYKAKSCMECGHCIAVCPKNAVAIENLDMSEVLELKDIKTEIDPDVYLNHLKSRRTIRKFTNAQVSKEQVQLILDAGRFSPTGGNLQTVAYHVYQDGVPAFRDLIMSELRAMGEEAVAQGSTAWYPNLWIKMYDRYKATGMDELFFNAGTVIVVSSNNPQAAMIAAAHMETMIYSMGLGMLYSGFTTRAIAHSADVKAAIGLHSDYEAYAVLVIGQPDVKYLRTVPRKKADVLWD